MLNLKCYPLSTYKKTDEGLILSGAMSPMLVAKEFCEQIGMKYNHVARLQFEDDEIWQIYEDGYKSGLTGLDHLVIAATFGNCDQIGIIIDMGNQVVPVCMAFSDNPEDITITPSYDKAVFEKKPDRNELIEILTYLSANPKLYHSNNFDEMKAEYAEKKKSLKLLAPVIRVKHRTKPDVTIKKETLEFVEKTLGHLPIDLFDDPSNK